MKITEHWIRHRVQLGEKGSEDVKTLILQGTSEEKVSNLGTALANFMHLTILDLSRNELQTIQGIEHIKTLEVLNLYYNSIEDLIEVKRLQCNPKLRDLDLRLNPISRLEADYQRYLTYLLPQLRILDCRPVRYKGLQNSYLRTTGDFERIPYSRYNGNSTQTTYSFEESVRLAQCPRELAKMSEQQCTSYSYIYANEDRPDQLSRSDTRRLYTTEFQMCNRPPGLLKPVQSSSSNHQSSETTRFVEFHSPKDLKSTELDHPVTNEIRRKMDRGFENESQFVQEGPETTVSSHVPTHIGQAADNSIRAPIPQLAALTSATTDSSKSHQSSTESASGDHKKFDQPFLLTLKSLIRDAVSESFAQYANQPCFAMSGKKSLGGSEFPRTSDASLSSVKTTTNVYGTSSRGVKDELSPQYANPVPAMSLSTTQDRLSLSHTSENANNFQKFGIELEGAASQRFHRPFLSRLNDSLPSSCAPSSWSRSKLDDYGCSSFIRSSASHVTKSQIHIERYVRDVQRSAENTFKQHTTAHRRDLYGFPGSVVLD